MTFREAEPPEAISLLHDGVVDLAITFSYPGDPTDPHRRHGASITTMPLWRDEMVLVLPRDHELARGRSAQVSALAAEPWIAGCQLCRGNLLSICHAAGFDPTITHETDNMVATVNFVNAGLGIALIPRLALAAANPPDRVAILSTVPRSYRTVNLVALANFAGVPSNLVISQLLTEMSDDTWHLEPATTDRTPLSPWATPSAPEYSTTRGCVRRQG